MLNNVVLVGRLTKDPSLSEGENETKRLNITIAIPRDYKNQEHKIAKILKKEIAKINKVKYLADHTCEYCKKGDIIGIKGRLQSSSYLKDDVTYYKTEVVAQRISFLSAKKINDNDVNVSISNEETD